MRRIPCVMGKRDAGSDAPAKPRLERLESHEICRSSTDLVSTRALTTNDYNAHSVLIGDSMPKAGVSL